MAHFKKKIKKKEKYGFTKGGAVKMAKGELLWTTGGRYRFTKARLKKNQRQLKEGGYPFKTYLRKKKGGGWALWAKK